MLFLGGRGSRVVRGCTFLALDRLDPFFSAFSSGSRPEGC